MRYGHSHSISQNIFAGDDSFGSPPVLIPPSVSIEIIGYLTDRMRVSDIAVTISGATSGAPPLSNSNTVVLVNSVEVYPAYLLSEDDIVIVRFLWNHPTGAGLVETAPQVVTAAPDVIAPSLTFDAQRPGSNGQPDSVPAYFSYAGTDIVDLYYATGTSGFPVDQAALIAGSGSAIVQFGSFTGYTGQQIDLTDLTDDTVEELAIVAVERNNGGTSGIQRVSLTNIDFTAASFVSAAIVTGQQNTVLVSLDDTIFGTTMAADWTITGNSVIDAQFVLGSKEIELTLGTTANAGDDYTGDLTYTGNGITDERGNILRLFENVDITNTTSPIENIRDTFSVANDLPITSYVGESGLAYFSVYPANVTIDASTGRARSNAGSTGSRYIQRGSDTYTETWFASGTLVYGSDPRSINCTCIAICTIDPANYYFARYNDFADAIEVVRIGGANGTAIIGQAENSPSSFGFTNTGDTLEIGLSYDGVMMQLLLDGTLEASFGENDHQAGGVGIYARDGAGSGQRHELADFIGGGI